jgi:hypothetical protein
MGKTTSWPPHSPISVKERKNIGSYSYARYAGVNKRLHADRVNIGAHIETKHPK